MRALLFAALAKGKSVIHHPLASPDTTQMIQACQLLGARVTGSSHRLEVEGVNGILKPVEDVIHAGNSGLILRFLSAVAALCPSTVVITGDHSIRHQRPMGTLLHALNQLGAEASSTRANGFAPLVIRGPLKGGTATLEGQDSQPVSALLIACALAEKPTELRINRPGEKPWVSLTLDWLDRLGLPYENEAFSHYSLKGGGTFNGFDYQVPGDWSSAAFPLAAALISDTPLTLHNVDFADPQGDKALVEILIEMGALIVINREKKSLQTLSRSSLKGIAIDINRCIDAVTILAVIACYAEGMTRIYNGAIARQKECDRLHSIATELKKMGAEISEQDDGLVIHGRPLKGAVLSSHGDHRMALSLAVAALGAKGDSSIHEVACVTKTFPDFATQLRALGAKIEEHG
jgi:3-phosphoshikimate 1-carboxyvinyltransferase